MRKLFSLLAMMVVTITAMAQTGTLQNANFSEGLVADASINSDGMKEVPSWRINSANGQYRAGAVVAYGSTSFVGYAAPSAGPEGSNGQGLAVLSAWTNTTQYVQDVTLAAGKYKMTVPVFNTAGTNNFVKNLIGVKYGETEKYATALSYPVGAWTVEAVEFELTEETEVTVSLGYEGANVSNSASQHLFIDCVKLEAPAAGPEVTISTSFFSGEEEIALSAESAVSVESASAIKVGFGEGADAVKYATYTINEVVDAEGDGAPMDITKPLITKATQFHSPMTTDDEQTDGDIEAVYPFLLDGDLETYWHSRWEDDVQPMGTHYLQVSDIEEESIVLVMSRRHCSNDHVTSMSVWGYDTADDAIAKTQGVKLAEIELPFGEMCETLTSAPFQTQGKSVLRFYAETTYGTGTSCNRGYWHCSEFQLYPATDGDGNQTQETPIATGQLNLNGFGYAEFDQTLLFKAGTKYNLEIKAWDSEDIFNPDFSIKDPVATFKCDFNGAYEAPAEGPVVAIEEGEGTYTVTSTSADAALYYICKPYSYLDEGDTPESVLQENIEALADMISSEEEWELYAHMGLEPAPKTFTIADYAEKFSGEECFLIAANVGWDGEKIAVISNVEKVNFTPEAPAAPEVTLIGADESEYALNDHSTVTFDQPISAIKVAGLDQEKDYNYNISEGSTTLAEGLLSINTIGYAEFGPLSLYEGHEYTLTLTTGSETVATYTLIGAMEEENVEEYAVNFDKETNLTITRGDRSLTSVSLTEDGKEAQTIAVGTKVVWNDKTAESFTVAPGAIVTPSVSYAGSWMNAYVYLDEDQDGAFDVEVDNDAHTATGDLKAFSFYSFNPSSDAKGWNSKGEEVTGGNRSSVALASFTAPAEEGTYRMRFKVDWNCIDPAGQYGAAYSGNFIDANGGYIVDVTLNVEAPATEPVDLDKVYVKSQAGEYFGIAGGQVAVVKEPFAWTFAERTGEGNENAYQLCDYDETYWINTGSNGYLSTAKISETNNIRNYYFYEATATETTVTGKLVEAPMKDKDYMIVVKNVNKSPNNGLYAIYCSLASGKTDRFDVVKISDDETVIPAEFTLTTESESSNGAIDFQKVVWNLLNEDTTGIATATTTATTDAIFSITGQRIMKLQKGINIVGGKKVIR